MVPVERKTWLQKGEELLMLVDVEYHSAGPIVTCWDMDGLLFSCSRASSIDVHDRAGEGLQIFLAHANVRAFDWMIGSGT